jgi:acetylglutamate kinase
VKVLVKLGGTLVDNEAGRKAIATQLATLAREHELVVVHGGGKQVTRHLEERGIQSRFVGGLRVSDEAVIDAVTQVIAGKVNKQLASAVTAAGRAAVGLSGVDGLLTRADRLNPELGFVGRPGQTKGDLLDLLLRSGYLPVVACIAGDESGNIYNVNADQMAVSCAAGWHATRLIFLTDVPGVKDTRGEVLPRMTPTAVEVLVRSGVAHGGMQAKLEAAVAGLRAGISNVTIAFGREPDVCRRLVAGENLGTTLALDETV